MEQQQTLAFNTWWEENYGNSFGPNHHLLEQAIKEIAWRAWVDGRANMYDFGD